MLEHLFVYGSLAPGAAHHDLLEMLPGQWEQATVRGYYSVDGWGYTGDYPALVIVEGGPPVSGWVLGSEQLIAHWERIDAFEGDGYERVGAEVMLANGATVMAHTYVLAGEQLRAAVISNRS